MGQLNAEYREAVGARPEPQASGARQKHSMPKTMEEGHITMQEYFTKMDKSIREIEDFLEECKKKAGEKRVKNTKKDVDPEGTADCVLNTCWRY